MWGDKEQPGEERTLLHVHPVTPGVSVKMLTFVRAQSACTWWGVAKTAGGWNRQRHALSQEPVSALQLGKEDSNLNIGRGHIPSRNHLYISDVHEAPEERECTTPLCRGRRIFP